MDTAPAARAKPGTKDRAAADASKVLRERSIEIPAANFSPHESAFISWRSSNTDAPVR